MSAKETYLTASMNNLERIRFDYEVMSEKDFKAAYGFTKSSIKRYIIDLESNFKELLPTDHTIVTCAIEISQSTKNELISSIEDFSKSNGLNPNLLYDYVIREGLKSLKNN